MARVLLEVLAHDCTGAVWHGSESIWARLWREPAPLASRRGLRRTTRDRASRAADPLLVGVPRPRRPLSPGRVLRPPVRRAGQARGAAPGPDHARVADPAGRRAALGPLPEGAARRADGLAR